MPQLFAVLALALVPRSLGVPLGRTSLSVIVALAHVALAQAVFVPDVVQAKLDDVMVLPLVVFVTLTIRDQVVALVVPLPRAPLSWLLALLARVLVLVALPVPFALGFVAAALRLRLAQLASLKVDPCPHSSLSMGWRLAPEQAPQCSSEAVRGLFLDGLEGRQEILLLVRLVVVISAPLL